MQASDRIPAVVRRTVLVLVGLAAFMPAELLAQRVVPVYQEPRHRLVLDKGDLKVLDVQIQPGDTTLLHTHAEPILYTQISSGQGPTDGRTFSNTDYATEAYTHAVNNQGPNLFRILAMPHFGPAVEGNADAPPMGLTGEPQLINPWFRSYRIELAPGEQTAPIRHYNPALVIQVSEGHTDVSNEEMYGADLTRLGDWTWREPGTTYRIRNEGSTPVAVVVSEGRRAR